MQPDNSPDATQDPERTQLLPTPGGRARVSGPTTRTVTPFKAHGVGLNPLVRAAHPLLGLVTSLRNMHTHPDVDALRRQLVAVVRTFEAEARAAGVDFQAVAAARYALCTFLDEAISATPWGGGGVWSRQSLLVVFHNEAFGGEKFFQVLQKLCQQPRPHLDVIELMYLCLALGMEGRYQVIDGGRSQLESLRERLQQLLRRERGAFEPELSPHWRGAAGEGTSLMRALPLWVLATAVASVLLAVYLFFSFRLNFASDPVFANLGGIRAAAAPARANATPAPAAPRVAGFLAPEIAQGLVSVVDSADRSVVTLRGEGIFAPGKADVSPPFLSLLVRIGDALAAQPGNVTVTGHTDNTRGFSARFPSNFDLSKGRASTVRALLAARAGPPERYAIEGRGEAEPLAPNDTAANRSRNRRVEIVLLTPPQTSAQNP